MVETKAPHLEMKSHRTLDMEKDFNPEMTAWGVKAL